MKKTLASILLVFLLPFSLLGCTFGAINAQVDKDGGYASDDVDSGEKNEQNDTQNNAEDIPNEPYDAKYSTYISAQVSGVNVRNGAGNSYPSLGKMDMGDMLSYRGEEGNWYITVYKEKTAYVSKLYTRLEKIEKGSEKAENVIEVGETLLGYPYVWGSERYHWGNGKLNTAFVNGQFDCSALTQYAYYMGAGVLLDVTSRSQSLQGTLIPKNDIVRGDLLFFTNSSRKNNTGLERIGHVGIYLGNNYILHTASDYAVIEEISSLRWSYYISAKRFF